VYYITGSFENFVIEVQLLILQCGVDRIKKRLLCWCGTETGRWDNPWWCRRRCGLHPLTFSSASQWTTWVVGLLLTQWHANIHL